MKVLTDDAARSWLRSRGISTSDTGHLSFDVEKRPVVIPLDAPRTRESLSSLATNLVGILDSDAEWLLWLKDFDIWSTDTEEIGWELIDALSSADQPKLAVNSSALLFTPSEKIRVKAALVVPMLFMWDAYLVNGDGETFVRIDHDDHSSISTISDKVRLEIKGSQLDHRPSSG